MSGPVMISSRTAADLAVVAKSFGIDMEWNSHLFRYAAQVDARAFEVVIRALAEAVQQDARYGVERRIREGIAQRKGRK